jgi:hypothetical protein
VPWQVADRADCKHENKQHTFCDLARDKTRKEIWNVFQGGA